MHVIDAALLADNILFQISGTNDSTPQELVLRKSFKILIHIARSNMGIHGTSTRAIV